MHPTGADRPPLDHRRLSGLEPFRVEVVEAAESTNALVVQRARAGEGAGLVVVAEHQQAGRGRLDRVWETPPRAAVTFSMLVDPEVSIERWPLLPLLAGFVVDTVLAEWVGEAGLKWPNDVLATGPDGVDRKLCGILVERVETPGGPLAVVGIGINAAQTPEELPSTGATSVLHEMRAHARATGEPEDAVAAIRVDRTELLETFLLTWHALAGPLLSEPQDLLAGYRAVCRTLGQRVDVHLPGGRIHTGTALDLDSTGALVVGDGPGALTVTAGDVVHVRPAG
jgi:BirA family biotin operon repressor/biotin-[acetyl-CoA-carboxylase] ligase